MKKNTIIYILSAVIAVGAIGFGGAFAMHKAKTDTVKEETVTGEYYQGIDDAVDPAAAYKGDKTNTKVVLETKEKTANGKTRIVEYFTDKSGKVGKAEVVTKAGGVKVTSKNGENVTKTPVASNKTAIVQARQNTTKAAAKKTTKKAAAKTTAKAAAKSKKTTGNFSTSGGNMVGRNGNILFSYSYSKSGNYFFTDEDPWQRNFGFNRMYDMASAFIVMYYDTIRVPYKYGKYEWMVQMWKGQYGLLFIGSEIGLYYRTPGLTHYECATTDMEIPMQMTLYRQGKTDPLFVRPYADHWWTTAFVPGRLKKFADRSELTMIGKIKFKTEAEAKIFCSTLASLKDANGHQFKATSKGISRNNAESYVRKGSTVDFVWRYFNADAVVKKPTTTAAPTTKASKTTKPSTTAPAKTESTTKVIEYTTGEKTTAPETTTRSSLWWVSGKGETTTQKSEPTTSVSNTPTVPYSRIQH